MLEQELNEQMGNRFQKTIENASDEEVYQVLLEAVKQRLHKSEEKKGRKKLYYISAEFLIGKLLANNLINLGLYEEVKQILEKNGKELSHIEELEPEPSLGNGGLGRLASCFLDSIATLGLCGDGIGLNYHCGLFKQVFKEHKQKELPNFWNSDTTWPNKTDIHFQVPFAGFDLTSTLYYMDITGYGSGTNKLHLFDLDTVDEGIIQEGSIAFNKEDIRKNLTLFLYPDDCDEQGQLLRIYQQYFMVSNAAQLILMECKEKGYDLQKLHEHVVIQINDTHPSLIIPELIRLLQAEGLSFEKAVEEVKSTCAYTNHTILAEALEKWPIHYLERVVPHLVPIIKELDAQIKKECKDSKVWIIDGENRVHMAHMDIHYSFSVNGVAALHTKILKDTELKSFCDIYPGKFNNKTNGITFRRWLMYCNPTLDQFITKLIGEGYKKDALELKKLRQFTEDGKVLEELLEIKMQKKIELKQYLKDTQGVEIDENSIFDIQIKRLHEYKRQQMNALYVIYKYLEIKKGNLPKRPITVIFGAKAAPAYVIAKDIIHLILCLQEMIEKDPEVKKYLKVVMVEDYNVTKAEKLIPACDVSEQISLASKEASGTGNMKFMLNGAVTLGTEDGANLEISLLTGPENIYIFGESSLQVIEHYEKSDYDSRRIYESDNCVKEMVDFILSDQMLSVGSRENLERLHRELINKDWFMTLLDLKDYIETKERVFEDYENRKEWAKKMLVNISEAGYFSSDRTIKQYNDEIWHL